jgi:thiamine-phosphate pyrophosphorylase
MADSLAHAQLARAAERFRRAARSPLPALVLMTDDERLAAPRAAITALPRGSLVVVRAREKNRRIALVSLIGRLADERGLKWIVADDPVLAARAGADGAHFPEQKISLAAHWRVRRPGWLITCAAHSLHACLRAKRAGASAVVLSPVFPTASHAGKPSLGNIRARSIVHEAHLPIYALGGLDAGSAKQLEGAGLVGLAAITGLSVRFRDSDRCARDTVNV